MKTTLLFLLATFLYLNVVSQTQIGENINGSVSGEGFGQSVALSSNGSRIVIGAHYNDFSGISSGKVKVFDWNGASWIQTGSDINGSGVHEYVGFSTAISADGNRIAIGAHGSSDSNSAGYASVYDWNGNDWIPVGAKIYGEDRWDYSGYSIDLSANGNRIIIGAPRNDVNGTDSGHARIYDWNGSNWIQIGADIDGEARGDHFGDAVTISSNGSRIAVGAPINEGSGHTRIYDWNGSDWIQKGDDIDAEASGDLSGIAVDFSADGNRIAIGGLYNDGNGSNAGHVRLFDWDGSNWLQFGADIDGELTSDNSGKSVALSDNGNRVAIGAWANDGGGSSSGHIRVYDWNGTNWVKNIVDIDGETYGDHLGTSVALSSDRLILAGGAISSDGDAEESGDVRVFNLTEYSGLIAYYPFNGNANDESGNNHHSTVYGATLTQDKDGNTNNAYYFDGSNDYIDLGDWENGGEMSFTFWARWDATNNWSRIIEIGNGRRNDDIMVSNYFGSTEIAFYVNKGTTENYQLFHEQAIILNEWGFYTATVDLTGIMKIYKNGILISENLGLTPNKLIRTEQYLGRSLYPGDGYFKGAIDELRIYETALTLAEIQNLYNFNALKIEKFDTAIESNFYVSKNILYFKDVQNLNEIKTIEVYNLLGQKVFKTSKIEREISLEQLKLRVYILKVKNNIGDCQTLRFLIN